MLTFTSLYPFCGLGAGARGFLDAEVHLFGVRSRFTSLGGIDVDEEACTDFEHLTGSPAWCVDVEAITPAELRSRYGTEAPDVVFMSPPCKGASALLSRAKARTTKYRRMNELTVIWLRAMLGAWGDEPPRLVLLENVPRLKTRAAAMLLRARGLLRKVGYVLTDGFHDCGELGGLAQHRRRYLLVARHPRRCPPILYQPPQRKVRGCGEVLEQLPVPGTPEAAQYGAIHELPRISALNWLRLALIPAGGDWRDLPGVLEEGQARREVHRRYHVEDWSEPTGTVVGSHGPNGVVAVADPRVSQCYAGVYGVKDWSWPTGTVTGRADLSTGAFSVADPRVKRAFDAGYAVLGWEQAARTIAGQTAVGCGAYSVADPRKPPETVPVIISADGTWHRPLTTLELAALQGIPHQVRGAPLAIAGRSKARWRERIGNAVPTPTAEAIAGRMLIALTEGALGELSLSSSPVWVEPERRAEASR